MVEELGDRIGEVLSPVEPPQPVLGVADDERHEPAVDPASPRLVTSVVKASTRVSTGSPVGPDCCSTRTLRLPNSWNSGMTTSS